MCMCDFFSTAKLCPGALWFGMLYTNLVSSFRKRHCRPEKKVSKKAAKAIKRSEELMKLRIKRVSFSHCSWLIRIKGLNLKP